ncbi:MAG: hypothetical protein WCL70_01590 [Paludibacter sp.]
MDIEEDIVDLLKKKEQIEKVLLKFKSKENILSTEEVVIEEIERKLSIVQRKIEDY